MLKKFVLALVLVMLLSTFASAKNDNVSVGPYKVSFDIGQTRNDYIVNVTAPVATEALNGDKQTKYSMYIVNKTVLNRFVTITIRSLETPIPIVLGLDWAQAFNTNYLNNPNISGLKTDARTIDGASGGIASHIQKMDSGQNVWGVADDPRGAQIAAAPDNATTPDIVTALLANANAPDISATPIPLPSDEDYARHGVLSPHQVDVATGGVLHEVDAITGSGPFASESSPAVDSGYNSYIPAQEISEIDSVHIEPMESRTIGKLTVIVPKGDHDVVDKLLAEYKTLPKVLTDQKVKIFFSSKPNPNDESYSMPFNTAVTTFFW